jgi:hypothetical protein
MKPIRYDLTPSGLDAPPWCDPLLRQFGVNPWGESIFRVVWAPRRITLYGGYWWDNGLFEYRFVPRYSRKKCWMLERWIPARHFASPLLWTQLTCNSEGYLSNGPYPQYGAYFSCYLFANPDNSYIPLLPDLVLLTTQAIYSGRIRKTWEIRDAIISGENAKEALIDKAFDDRWDATHGVRRGISFDKDGALQNNEAEKQAYIQKLAASGIRLKQEEFQPGFRQL